MTKKEKLAAAARKTLLDNYIKPDSQLLIVLKSVSASGMCRRMWVMVENQNITHLIGELCDLSLNDNGLCITGCGMNMAFWLANAITKNLWPSIKQVDGSYKKNLPKGLTDNGGNRLDWRTI